MDNLAMPAGIVGCAVRYSESVRMSALCYQEAGCFALIRSFLCHGLLEKSSKTKESHFELCMMYVSDAKSNGPTKKWLPMKQNIMRACMNMRGCLSPRTLSSAHGDRSPIWNADCMIDKTRTGGLSIRARRQVPLRRFARGDSLLPGMFKAFSAYLPSHVQL